MANTYQTYKQLFGYFSYDNEVLCQFTFHNLVGTLLRDYVRIQKGGIELDPRVSFFYQQSSRSGKTTAYILYQNLAEKLGLKVLKPSRLNPDVLIGGFDIQPNGSYKKIPGILEQADVVVWNESELLFTTHRSCVEYLNEALDPIGVNQVGKYVIHGSNPIIIYPKCSLYLTGNFSTNVKPVLAETGFLQRTLYYPRQLSTNERKRMQSIDIDNLKQNYREKIITNSNIQALRLKVIRDLNSLVTFAKSNAGNKPDFSSPKVIGRIKMYVDKFYSRLDGCVTDVRTVMEEFITAYIQYLYIIAVHNAYLDSRTEISVEDIDYSASLIDKCLITIQTYFESVLEKKVETKKNVVANVFLEEYLKIVIKRGVKMNNDRPMKTSGVWVKLSDKELQDRLRQRLSRSRASIYFDFRDLCNEGKFDGINSAIKNTIYFRVSRRWIQGLTKAKTFLKEKGRNDLVNEL